MKDRIMAGLSVLIMVIFVSVVSLKATAEAIQLDPYVTAPMDVDSPTPLLTQVVVCPGVEVVHTSWNPGNLEHWRQCRDVAEQYLAQLRESLMKILIRQLSDADDPEELEMISNRIEFYENPELYRVRPGTPCKEISYPIKKHIGKAAYREFDPVMQVRSRSGVIGYAVCVRLSSFLKMVQ